MEKTIIDKNGHSNIIITDKIERIKLMATKIIIYFDSGDYMTILGCQEKEQEKLLGQLRDETTSVIHTQCSVKDPLQTVTCTKDRQNEKNQDFNLKDNLWD